MALKITLRLIVAVMLFALALYSFRRRNDPDIRAFIVWALLLGLDLLIVALTPLAPNEQIALLLWDSRFIIRLGHQVALVVTIIIFTGRQDWLTRSRVLWMMALPIFTQSVIWAYPLHQMDSWITPVTFTSTNGYFIPVVGPSTLHISLTLLYDFLLVFVGFGISLQALMMTDIKYHLPLKLIAMASMLRLFTLGFESTFFSLDVKANDLHSNLLPCANLVTGFLLAYVFNRYDKIRILSIDFRKIVKDVANPIIIFDGEQRISFANDRFLELFVNDGTNPHGEALTMCPHKLSMTTIAQTVHSPTGTLPTDMEVDGRIYAIYKETVKLDHGNTYTVINPRDVTYIRQLQRQQLAMEIEQERARLLATFIDETSHEFRTPLSVIKVKQYLLSRTTDVQKQQKFITDINQQIDLLTSLVDNMVTMTKLSYPDTVEKQACDLNECIRDAITNTLPIAAEHEIQIQFTPNRTLRPLQLDSDHITNAIAALIDNGVRFSGEGDVVTITAEQTETETSIIVKDTGTGISKDDLPHIFDRFYRADKAHSTPGLGLGLAIAQATVQAHHGEITVDSEEGEGSRIVIRLPNHPTTMTF